MKRYFPIPFVTFLSITSLYTLYQLFTQPSLSWLATAFAAIPMLGFFIAIYVIDIARSSRYLPIQLSSSAIALGLTLASFESIPAAVLTFISCLGNLAYIFWYTPLNRHGSKITLGQALPPFSLTSINGDTINPHASNNRYRVWLFIRANWCPLCVAQVKELVNEYKMLESLNCDTFIISSQSEQDSQKLAKQMNAPLHFTIDKDNQAAKALGIEHIGGTPFGIPGFEANTALPTVIITAPDNSVIFVDQTDDYRIRPEPSSFILHIQQHQQTQDTCL